MGGQTKQRVTGVGIVSVQICRGNVGHMCGCVHTVAGVGGQCATCVQKTGGVGTTAAWGHGATTLGHGGQLTAPAPVG